MVSVFAADLELLSKFVGHQGASAKFLCMFCDAIKLRIRLVFVNQGIRTSFNKRTLAKIQEDGTNDKKKMRPHITQNLTNSIVGLPLANVEPDEDCSPATVHVLLGITPWLVRVRRAAYRRLELLEVEARNPGAAPPQFQETVEDCLRIANEYEAYLTDQLACIVSEIDAQQQFILNIYQQVAYHEQIINQVQDSWEQAAWRARLDQLREHQQHAITCENS